MHKRLLSPVLDGLDDKRRSYVSQLGDTLEGDPQIEKFANLVFVLLARTAPFIPLQLPRHEAVGRLIAFVERNHHRLVRAVYDPAFVRGEDLVMPVAEEFVAEMTLLVLKRFDKGELTEEGGEIYRLRWPFDASVFPYQDPDDDDDLP